MNVRRALAIFLTAASALGAAVACSSSSSSSAAPAACTPGQATCGQGQTCWPIADGRYGCIGAGSAAFGTTCQNELGVATCSANLSCDQTQASGGTCTSYCSSIVACPSGYACEQVSTASDAGTTLSLCRTSTDAGTVLVTTPNGGNGGGNQGGGDSDGGFTDIAGYNDGGYEAGNELPQ